jgi:RecQ mediated genome instability protein
MILKIKNISAPKFNETSKTAPKLLKIALTGEIRPSTRAGHTTERKDVIKRLFLLPLLDGVNTHSAIEMEPTSLSIETKPGTKVRKKNFTVSLTLYIFFFRLV